jgi:DNA repair protein RecO (recombination protein O)
MAEIFYCRGVWISHCSVAFSFVLFFCYARNMQKYTAIILLSRNTNEFDRIYIMYTLETGLARAVAKGARKPAARLAGHLEPATLSEVYIARARGIGQITSSITISGYENIKKNFALLEIVLPVLKFFAKNFREDEEDEKIFFLLKEFMKILNSQSSTLGSVEKTDKKMITAEAFWWKLFDLLGQKPEMLKCVKCSHKLIAGKNNFFSPKLGGILCESCRKAGFEAFPINENQIKLLRIFFGNTLKDVQKIKISSTDIRSLEKIRNNYQKYYFG